MAAVAVGAGVTPNRVGYRSSADAVGFTHPAWARGTVTFGKAVSLRATRLDYPILTPSKAISGVTRDQAGTALGGCVVKLFRQADDVLCQSIVSDGFGAYTFPRDSADVTTYYVLSYHLAPEVHGTSDRGLVAQ